MDKKSKEFVLMEKKLAIVETKLDEHCRTQKDEFERFYDTLKSIENKFDNLDIRYLQNKN